ncbi:8208_t:CDS:2 [Racocetra persica]|uniref:8208_t:CDS:1 n=1 Tax=Racocetra persica TaxID=160502 RepID=A0ACA9K9X7_9GLOM|nr:8208_t:CDS:2 [Racocetra persica]
MTPEEFNSGIFLLTERGPSIFPQESDSDSHDLAQIFKDKSIQPTVENVYWFVTKSKVKKSLGDFDDSIVTRYGELLWFTIPDKEQGKIKEQYQNIADEVIKILTPCSPEPTTLPVTSTDQQYEDVFNGGTSYFSQTSHNEQSLDSNDQKLVLLAVKIPGKMSIMPGQSIGRDVKPVRFY